MAEDKFSKSEIKKRIEENELDLSMCAIVKIPVQNIIGFPKVTRLDLSCNKISYLPDTFAKLKQLVQLDLSKNSLAELPDNFGELTNLKRLDLFSNQLSVLPVSFTRLENLKWLDLKNNPIQEALPKIVGDCLSPKDCQMCAVKVLQYMQEVTREKDRQRQKEMELKRANELKEKRQKEAEMELRKRQKKEEKERRRQAYLEQEKERMMANGNAENHSSEDTTSSELSTPDHIQGNRGGQGYKIILVIVIAISIAVCSALSLDIIKVQDLKQVLFKWL